MTPEQEARLTDLLRQAAQDRQKDGELEVDDNAIVSMSDQPEDEGGAYVAAWMWIPFTDEMYRVCSEAPPEGAA